MLELKLIKEFPQEIIALDEVGRSPLSGPVVIGAVRIEVKSAEELGLLVRSLRRSGVRDSKMLTHEKREEILLKFKAPVLNYREKRTFHWKGIEISYVTWEMDHNVIDSENIFQASMRGMKEAAEFLSASDKTRTTVLIDGQSKLRWSGEPPPWKELPIIKGDAKSSLIGLASVLAKEKRDSYMREMHLLYPHYGFNSNFGYPTAFHREAIRLHGPCYIHRKSFGKVKEFVVK